MIYTVTLNPSLDYIATVNHFTPGRVNRTASERILPGGKGINVSIVLHNLGMDSTALGFVAGFTGEEIQKRVQEFKISAEFVKIRNGISRINVKLRSDEESEINGMGPDIDEDSLNMFLNRLNEFQEGDTLVLAGSIPASLPDTIYRDIMQTLEGKGVRIVVDATKDLLVNVLAYHPFLIKPNHMELGEIFGVDDLKDKDMVVSYAKKLQEKGARNVLVSMAGDGAVLLAENGLVCKSEAPKGTVKNSVGAGDSMVAGFLYGYFLTHSYEEAFRYGVCAGSASAFSDNLATREEVMQLMRQENGFADSFSDC